MQAKHNHVAITNGCKQNMTQLQLPMDANKI